MEEIEGKFQVGEEVFVFNGKLPRRAIVIGLPSEHLVELSINIAGIVVRDTYLDVYIYNDEKRLRNAILSHAELLKICATDVSVMHGYDERKREEQVV